MINIIITSILRTVTKLAISSKEADEILKKVKVVESKCMNNEVTLEELDKNLRQTIKMVIKRLIEIESKIITETFRPVTMSRSWTNSTGNSESRRRSSRGPLTGPSWPRRS